MMLFAGRNCQGVRFRPLALEARLLFDGAALATAAFATDLAPSSSGAAAGDRAAGADGSGAATGTDGGFGAGDPLLSGATAPASEPVRIEVHKGAFTDVHSLREAVDAGPAAVGSADATGVDAADAIHYAITVVNRGSQSTFDLQVQDSLPPGIDLSMVSGLRLIGEGGHEVDYSGGHVLRNATSGERITSEPSFALALFCGDAVEFVDPGHGEGFLGGSCDAHRDSQITIAYQVTLPVSVVAGSTLVNEASVVNAADRECGPNLVSACDPPSDPATVTIAGAELTTRLTATDQLHTDGRDAVIGEILTYETVITVPEGSSPAAVLTQTLAPGLVLVSVDRITASEGVHLGDAPDPSSIRPEGVDGGVANRFVVDFGHVVNRNTDNCVADTITVVYRAVTANVLGNQQGEALVTAAAYRSGGTPAADCAPVEPLVDLVAYAEPVTVVEPVLTVSVAPDGEPVNVGGRVEFVVTVRNDSLVDAFDVSIEPPMLPPGLSAEDGAAVAMPDLPVLRAGEQAVWRFGAVVGPEAPLGEPLPVDVAVRYTSIPDSTSYADGHPPGTGPENLSPFVTGIDRQRTGADGPTGLDDYFAADSGSATPVPEASTPPAPAPAPTGPPTSSAPPDPSAPPPAPAPVGAPSGSVDDRAPASVPLFDDGTTAFTALAPLPLTDPFLRDFAVAELKSLEVLPVVAGDRALSTEKAVAKDDECVPIRPQVVKKVDAAPKPVPRSVFAEGVAKPVKRDVSEPTVPVKKRVAPIVKPRPAPGC